jgi:hypothetical protein
VVLACIQVARDQAGRDLLKWGGIILGAIMALVAALVIFTGYMRRRTR